MPVRDPGQISISSIEYKNSGDGVSNIVTMTWLPPTNFGSDSNGNSSTLRLVLITLYTINSLPTSSFTITYNDQEINRQFPITTTFNLVTGFGYYFIITVENNHGRSNKTEAFVNTTMQYSIPRISSMLPNEPPQKIDIHKIWITKNIDTSDYNLRIEFKTLYRGTDNTSTLMRWESGSGQLNRIDEDDDSVIQTINLPSHNAAYFTTDDFTDQIISIGENRITDGLYYLTYTLVNSNTDGLYNTSTKRSVNFAINDGFPSYPSPPDVPIIDEFSVGQNKILVKWKLPETYGRTINTEGCDFGSAIVTAIKDGDHVISSQKTYNSISEITTRDGYIYTTLDNLTNEERYSITVSIRNDRYSTHYMVLDTTSAYASEEFGTYFTPKNILPVEPIASNSTYNSASNTVTVSGDKNMKDGRLITSFTIIKNGITTVSATDSVDYNIDTQYRIEKTLTFLDGTTKTIKYNLKYVTS